VLRVNRILLFESAQVPEGRKEQAASAVGSASFCAPATVVGAPVALVQSQAGGDRRPAAHIPAERFWCCGPRTAATDQPVGQPVVRHRVQVSIRATVPDG